MSGVRRSPEIEAIVLRWTGLIAEHRTNDLPQGNARVYVGLNAGEVWRGQVLRDGIADYPAEVPPAFFLVPNTPAGGGPQGALRAAKNVLSRVCASASASPS
jgi:hypothetical protein